MADKFKDVGQMAYGEAAGQLRTGDILLGSGNYVVSELIKRFSDSMFSHVAVIVRWRERPLIMESVEDDGVRLVPLTHYLDNYENRRAPYNGKLYIARHRGLAGSESEDARVGAIVDRGLDLLNRKYDNEEIARIVSRIGLGLGRHEDNDAYICSEFVEECFARADIYFQKDERGFIYPRHVAEDARVDALFRLL
ncbi:YiiX/YebB-like N1pC/P60 family cysteine hydrolase [Paenibacillus methanolicus]|uniref:Permuted papain-like amidase YaeF/Yiix C92 family enzyme n=1 Tax=Paenibacillus methanolicus TaxID=582686 RepID=A0A5S5BZV4_9BACL|nr:YiiX/YebB-like N1pC/P60 family cysteine hydrolase [Paenibacillus methanolicus]TYP71223.1 permuted papain-like amidase YaeF/Yiix C92 family enzyme [Paenibacillus methanolicus]